MPQIVDCVIVGLALAARARSFEKAHFNVATTYFYFRRFDDGEFMQPQARARPRLRKPSARARVEPLKIHDD